MHDGIGGMPRAPVEILPGLLGGFPIRGTSGSNDFGRLLGVIGTTPGVSFGEGGSFPVSELHLGPETEMITTPPIPLYMPLDLAPTLGLIAQPFPDETGQLMATDDTQLSVPVRVGWLSTNDENNHALYLKIRPEDNVPESLPVMADGGETGEEKELLMRLRTVEQREGRIIADAELQTATGEEVSVRLRLEAAGSLNQIRAGIQNQGQSLISNPETTGRMAAETIFHGFDTNLPQSEAGLSRPETSLLRLLHNLDVKSIVIEQVKGENEFNSRDLLPRITSLPREGVGPRIMAGLTTTAESESAAAVAEAKNPLLFTMGNNGGNSRFSGFDSDRRDSSRSASDGSAPAAQTTAPTSNMTAESNAAAAPGILVSETGNVAAPPGSKADPAPLRFYNMEQKLDQLKQNPGQKISIQLVPAQLGKMELSIASHRGLVTVNLTVDSMQARQAVERNLPRLESQLTSSGIRVDSIQLQISQPSKGLSHSAFHHQYDHGQGGFNGHRGHDSRRNAYDRQKTEQFNLSGAGFHQTLVNCLA